MQRVVPFGSRGVNTQLEFKKFQTLYVSHFLAENPIAVPPSSPSDPKGVVNTQASLLSPSSPVKGVVNTQA
jgi:hypothetical protein